MRAVAYVDPGRTMHAVARDLTLLDKGLLGLRHHGVGNPVLARLNMCAKHTRCRLLNYPRKRGDLSWQSLKI
jgi:hypothetical protein